MGVLKPLLAVPFSYSDDFNRANNSDPGPNWAEITSAFRYEIASNQLICPNSNQPILWTTALPSNNYFAQVTIAVKDIHAASKQEIIVRSENGALTGKYYRVGPAGTGIIIERFDGSLSTIASAAVSFVNGDVLKVTCNGNVISGYKNGTLAVTITDTAQPVWDGRYTGMYTDSPFGWAVYDDWSAGNL